MSIQKIYTKHKSIFSDRIETFCQAKNIEFAILEKDDRNFEDIDALVIFHEDHNIDAAGQEARDTFEKKLQPIHKIDINGTKQVIVSHFGLWVERNKVGKPLFIGTDQLVDNPKLDGLLDLML
jgi:hypothetical protein